MASSIKRGDQTNVTANPMGKKVSDAIINMSNAGSGVAAATKGHAATGFSLEDFQQTTSLTASVETRVKASVDAAFGNGYYDTLTDCQRDAAIITARAGMSVESARDYIRKYDSHGTAEKDAFGVPVAMGSAAPFDYTMDPPKREISQEVFDDRNLQGMVATSIMHNIMASRQTPAAESFYPGYALPADGTGFTVEVDRPLVFDRIKHDLTGATADFNKQRQLLLNALMDPTVLASKGNLIVPFFVTGNAKNNESFTTAVAPANTTVAGETFLTNYYKPGVAPFSLLGISQHPGIAMLGQNDQTDTLDHRVTLQEILLEVRTINPANPSQTITSIISYRTDVLGFSSFLPAGEGQQRRLVLNFETQDLPLSVDTLDVNGVAASALAFLNGSPATSKLRLNVALSIAGSANLESSAMSVSTADGRIDTIQEVTGTGNRKQFTPIEDGAIFDQVKNQFTSIRFVGYKLEAFRTNINRRDQGKLTTNERLKDAHILPYSPTFTAQVPVIDGIHNTVDVSIPAMSLMIRNTNNAYSQLFTFEAALQQASDAYTKPVPNPAIRAIGRYILRRPWYDVQTLDLATDINSLRSHERLQDIQAAITNKMRTMFTTGFYETNFQMAMASVGIAQTVKPKIKIICNPILGNYIMTTGDNRTLGEGWSYSVEFDQDMRLYDVDADGKVTYRMYFIFSIDGIDGPHPLNFGNFVYLPDLMTNLPITRDQATTREMSYQSRTLHVNHCPVLFRLDVANLETAVAERVAVPITPV